MDTVPVWRTWPSRGWPCSFSEETVLRARLGDPAPFERDDLTLLITILRCGTTWAEASTLAPGLRPAPLAGAYDHLEAARSAASAALERVLERPTDATDEDLLAAEALSPTVVRRLVAAIAHGPDVATAAAGQLLASCRQVTERIRTVEDTLTAADPVAGRTFGRLLVDPWQGGLWGHDLYQPRRVADLSPVRVRDLLGERYPEHPLPA